MRGPWQRKFPPLSALTLPRAFGSSPGDGCITRDTLRFPGGHGPSQQPVPSSKTLLVSGRPRFGL